MTKTSRARLFSKFLLPCIGPFLFLLLAVFIYYLHIFNRLMYPNPLVVIYEFFRILFISQTLTDLSMTLVRVFLGTLLSIFVGVPLGLLLGYFTSLYKMFEFLIDFFRSLPGTALFPLFLLFFGIGNLSKILLSVWIASFVVLVNTSYGVRHTTKAYRKLAKVHGTPRSYLFVHILFFGALINRC